MRKALFFYGDNSIVYFDPAELNLRGQLYDHYDGSGRQWLPEGYDFKGNPVITSQRLLQQKDISDPDWSYACDVLYASAGNDNWSGFQDMLETGGAAWSSWAFTDALNRPVTVTDAGGNVTRNSYNKAGALKQVFLTPEGGNETAYVKDIHYDAKGQRKSIWYGNHTKTRYTYDPATYRLRRLLTTKRTFNTNTEAYEYSTLQDLKYYYDPVGNITTITDDAQQSIFYSNTLVNPTQDFTYDALYRLVKAKGREQIGSNDFGGGDNWADAEWSVPSGSDAAQQYTQCYTYDDAGNILQLKHSAGSGSYTRDYTYYPNSNRLLSTTVGSHTYSYNDYDSRGNMQRLPHLNGMYWNRSNEMKKVERGTLSACYQYGGGQRIRKWIDKGNIKEERIYLGSFEIYRKFGTSTGSGGAGSSLNDIVLERSTVHISDDTGRIAMLEMRNTDYDADGCEDVLTRYVHSNHLQSATLELDADGEIISYEEYHPYGTTAYQAKNAAIAATAKRYRYTGKERDEESGLYYHGARYYIPWLGRWCAVDPLESKYSPQSPYVYCSDNPVNRVDPSGMGDDDTLPKGVRNGGVSGSFTGWDSRTNSAPTQKPSSNKKGAIKKTSIDTSEASNDKQQRNFWNTFDLLTMKKSDLPWKDAAEKMEQHYEGRLNQLDILKSNRRAFDPAFNRWSDGEFLKSYGGKVLFKGIGKVLIAKDNLDKMNMLIDLGAGRANPIPIIASSGGEATGLAMFGEGTWQAGAVGLAFAAFSAYMEKTVQNKSLDFDLSVLQLKINEGHLAASNEINNSGLGRRLNIQAGFVDAETFGNIQERGELDLNKDNINSIKYLPENSNIPLGSDDKPYPYLLIYPNSEPKTKNFFILPIK